MADAGTLACATSAYRPCTSAVTSRCSDRRGSTMERNAMICVQDLSNDEQSWHGLPAKHVWSLWTRYACAAFYSHPWAWNEIGFGGPAYPRGYKNLGGREPWEVRDRVNREPIEIGSIVERARRQHAHVEGVE